MFWDSIISGGVSGLLKGAGEFATSMRTAITGDAPLSPEQKLDLLSQAAALEKAALEADVAMAAQQVSINAIEAQSDSIFKGGWRPAAGWVCVGGIFYEFLFRPIFPWLISLFAVLAGAELDVPAPASLDMTELMGLLMGLLGLGGFRAYEKVKGIASR